ncbi:hypothetical protein H4R26_000951 [Coemansia thaxteri]|uniref:CRIB domain-containing protein n=1 Tax=Coemansia thaxteri TaxID=2663907 RepID=A0A9W8EJP5_9FUNG|nr:hypothetical protein H4R26_000951 [Coemansia thaxteri]
MSASFDTARTHTSGPSSSSSFMGSQHERAGVASAMVPRRVQIQAIPHSTMSSDTLASKTTAATTLPSEMLAYGLPSADNGIPPHYQQPQHHHQQQHEADSGDGRKGTGLRAALASKFTPKKKTKEISRLSVNTERQQHQLESLLSLSKVGDGKEAVGPTVRGQPVGHPMSFQHVEHLSPTLIAPKLALINSSQLYKSSTVQPKSSAGVEKKSHFLGFKPSSLLTKPSKQSLNAGGSSAPVTESVRTVRGKPIGAPSEFKHVDHLSPDEFSTQQYQMLNHRQQQHEIVSVLTQPGGGGAAGERPKTRAATGPSSGSLPKITYRGLPLSGPVTFEHVEHISPKDYHAQLLSAKLAGVAPGSGPGATNELPALPAPATESTSAMPAQPTATAASKFAGSSNGGSARAQRAKQLFTQPLNIKPANSASSKGKQH